jgi:tetratricopeptide (TPR) repeat protein
VGRADSRNSQGPYRAFISYSHADRRVAEWLHGALEGYRLPAKLVGEATALGPVPARLGKLFRDRDELPAAGDLSTELVSALKRSMFLIVICSPAAAQSKWVNEEVRQFKLLHGKKRGDGTARVLALIADGDPGDAGGGACFPPALKFHVLPDGGISDDPAEPIAADIRAGGDGKKLALLKLVAGLTGLPLDSLVQREAARRQRRAALVSGVSLMLVAVMAVLTLLAVQGRREAERQRAQADGLVEYMLTDLRAKLEPVGRLEVLDSVGQRALAYYAAQQLDRLSPDELGRRARALHLVGEVRDLRGDSEGALTAFREAERTTAELLARDPENPDRMFDHAQSVFWVGQTAWARKDWPTAEAKFRAYAGLAEQMAATDPSNPKWRMEQGYAANSLGAFLLEINQPEAAVEQLTKYVSFAKQASDEAPESMDRRQDVGQSLAWLADAQSRAGLIDAAQINRLAELRHYSTILARDPKDESTRAMMGRAQDALAELHLFNGDLHIAAERARVAVETLSSVLAADPANQVNRALAVQAANIHAEALALQGKWEAANSANRQALSGARALVAADPQNRAFRTGGLLRALWMEVALLGGQGERKAAADALARIEAELGPFREKDIAAKAGSDWAMALSLAAAQRLGEGDAVGAQRLTEQGRRAAGAAPRIRERATLSALDVRMGKPAAPGLPGSYPAERLVDFMAQP